MLPFYSKMHSNLWRLELCSRPRYRERIVLCYSDFLALIWELSLEGEKEMRFCGIGPKGGNCESFLVLMDHFNQLFVH